MHGAGAKEQMLAGNLDGRAEALVASINQPEPLEAIRSARVRDKVFPAFKNGE